MTSKNGARENALDYARPSPIGNGPRLVCTGPDWPVLLSANFVHACEKVAVQVRRYLKVLDMSVRPLSHIRAFVPTWDSQQHLCVLLQHQ